MQKMRGIVSGEDGTALEEAANKLLSEHGAFDGEHIFTEIQLTRQDVRHQKIDSMEAVFAAQCDNFSTLDNIIIESSWRDIKAAALKKGIDASDLGMIEMRRAKETYDIIGKTFEIKPKTAFMRVNTAMKKIMKLPEFGIWEEIARAQGCLLDSWYRIFRVEIELKSIENKNN
jgi:hypothetical protein